MEKQKLKLVIADNSVQDRESKERTLSEMGMQILLSTGNGSKVLEMIRKKSPDVVIMDMVLPGIDAIGILEEVNRMHFLEKRPMFLIETALRMENLVTKALEAGADYYMMKPVSNRVLADRIIQLAERREGQLPMQPGQTVRKEKTDETAFDEQTEKRDPEKKTHKRYSGDLELDITNILLEIGIPAHIKGYQYIREGILMAFYDRNMLHYITKFLYPSIAQKYKTTSSSVERTIRHAIEIAWRRGDMEVLEEIFGNTISAGRGKPTNSEFMALLTDKLRLEYRAGSRVS